MKIGHDNTAMLFIFNDLTKLNPFKWREHDYVSIVFHLNKLKPTMVISLTFQNLLMGSSCNFFRNEQKNFNP